MGLLTIEEKRKKLHLISTQKPCKQEYCGVKYLKYWEKKNSNISNLGSLPYEITLQKWKRNKDLP